MEQPKRKFTTGLARDVTDSANLLAEMPEQMREWMNLRQGQFQHRVEKNGAVVIHPDQPSADTQE
jgi:hypothetical protein